jgi:drug/metabolite transporter (DMT)-like permease
MHSFRHIIYFISLGLFWGVSTSLYRYWGEATVPATHIIAYSGAGIAIVMGLVARRVEGSFGLTWPIQRYALVCAALMNIPFTWSLTLARHVPTAELALVFSMAPLISFLVGVVSGRDRLTARRTVAISVGFAASAILIISRQGMVSGEVSWWLLASFINPLLWASYNWFAQVNWPKSATTLSVGAAESLWSSILVLPFMIYFSPPWDTSYSGSWAVWSIIAATLMWVVERISFFTLIRERGASYTSQATYLATPASVLFAMFFFGGGSDIWLWASLALLMVALYLNNSGTIRPAAIQPSS